MADKRPKAEVNYRYHEVSGQNCRTCVFMNADGTCQKVVGIVKPKMVCDLFRAKR